MAWRYLLGGMATLAALSSIDPGVGARAQPPDFALAPVDAPPAIVRAERDRSERMTVPVTINGSGPFRFLVDTGAQATVLTARVSDALGLVPTGTATLVAMASRSTVETIALDGLEFGGRRFAGLTTPLLRDQHVGADGIIGLDSLQDLQVVIDFRADTIAVGDASAGDRAGYEIVVRARRKLGQMIITDARVGGVRTAIVIDTGSWHSIGNRALQRRLRAKLTDSMTSTDVTGATMRSELAVIGKLEIGRIGLADVPVGFTESPAFAALGLAGRPALILGIGNLRPFNRVAIDFASRRVLFDVPQGTASDRLDALFAAPPIGG